MTTDLMLYDDLAVMAAPMIVAGDEELRKDFARGADDAVEPDADEEQKEDDSDANEGQTVADHVAKIRRVTAEETFAVIKCGYLLINAKKELGADGYKIVLEQLGWEPRIAQLRVASANAFGKLSREVLAHFQPSAMYVLAPRSPISQHKDPVVQASKEAVAKAEAGHPVTWAWADGRIKEIKVKAKAKAAAKAKRAAKNEPANDDNQTTDLGDDPEGAGADNEVKKPDPKPQDPDTGADDADDPASETEVDPGVIGLVSSLDRAAEHFSKSCDADKKLIADRIRPLLRMLATTPYADDLRKALRVEEAAA